MEIEIQVFFFHLRHLKLYVLYYHLFITMSDSHAEKNLNFAATCVFSIVQLSSVIIWNWIYCSVADMAGRGTSLSLQRKLLPCPTPH